MNKKVMAIAMAAVMLMVAVTVGVSVQSDAEDPAPVVGGEKIIMGSEDSNNTITPLTIYTSQADGVNASIEFNESAFTSKKVISFKINENDGTSADLTNVSVTISKVNAGQNDGKYKVNVTGKTSTNDEYITVTIKLLVQDYVCANADHTTTHDSSCIALPTQEYDFVAYVKVIDNVKILLTGYGATESGSESESGYALTFAFEKDYSIAASVTQSGVPATGYKFYAVGLPTGISMTVDGVIGGKIANTYDGGATNSTSCRVYAVSEFGEVFSIPVTWTIGTKSTVGDYTINAEVKYGETQIGLPKTVSDEGYVTMVQGQTLIVTLSKPDSTVLSPPTVTFNGQNVQGDNGAFSYTPDGTGTFKVTVSSTVTTDGSSRGFEVQKTFTVYVVGQIVDADLDPTVTSN